MEMTITAIPGPPNETRIFGGKQGELIRHICKINFATALIYELFEQSQCWTSNVGYFAKFLSKEKKSTIGLALVAQWTDPAFYLN